MRYSPCIFLSHFTFKGGKRKWLCFYNQKNNTFKKLASVGKKIGLGVNQSCNYSCFSEGETRSKAEHNGQADVANARAVLSTTAVNRNLPFRCDKEDSN